MKGNLSLIIKKRLKVGPFTLYGHTVWKSLLFSVVRSLYSVRSSSTTGTLRVIFA